MECEICGKYIEKGRKVKVEGSIVTTCDKCASCGELVSEIEPYTVPKIQKEVKETDDEKFEIKIEKDLVNDFSKIIQKKREEQGMKQEELAKKINQPKSLVHRIESGKFKPNENLAREIEKVLGVSLFEDTKEINVERKVEEDEAPTLGDLVIIKKRKKTKK